MANTKLPIFDPGTSEIQSPFVAGLSEGISKLAEILNIKTEHTTIQLNNVPITDDDKNRIYQAANGYRLWLNDPAPVIKKNDGVIVESTDNFTINYVGGSIAFEPNSRLQDEDKIEAEFTYAVNESEALKAINAAISGLEDKVAKFIHPIQGAAAPTIGTEGIVGQDYIDTATGDKYHCTEVTLDGSYTWVKYQDELKFDDAPTADSDNPVTSGGVHTALATKADLVEGKVKGEQLPERLVTHDPEREYSGTLEINADKLEGHAAEYFATAEQFQRKPNPNLLDNWYFGNPINQRGQTAYTISGKLTYTIDRWAANDGSTVSIAGNGLNLTIPESSLYQYTGISYDEFKLLANRKATFSVLTVSNELITVTVMLPTTIDAIKSLATAKGRNISIGISVHTSKSPLFVRIFQGTETLLAAKLELGSEQTLAHQENGVWVLNEIPDYGEQLARCQRYQIKINSGPVFTGRTYARDATNAVIFIPTPVTMRTNPNISFPGSSTASAWYNNGQIHGTVGANGVVSANGITAKMELENSNIGAANGFLWDANDILLDANL